MAQIKTISMTVDLVLYPYWVTIR